MTASTETLNEIVKLLDAEGFNPFIQDGAVVMQYRGKWYTFATVDQVMAFLC